jgi:hypothetical protein
MANKISTWLLSVTLSAISASLWVEEVARDISTFAVNIHSHNFGNRQCKIHKIHSIFRRHETAVENVKNQSSTAMSTEQVKSGNLFHAINETAQEN